MESGNHLGIYWSKSKAVAVCLAPGRERKVLDSFSVAVEGQEQGQQALADRLAQACRERKVHFTTAAVALDCALFMQHSVHSEFSDPKRVAATVRFDTEEALATDISDMAVSFRITASADDGAQLDVFTAQRGVLSDLLLSLQSQGIDPVAVHPDVCCLARYLVEHGPAAQAGEKSTLYAILSDKRGYLVVVSPARQALVLRTFLIGSAQDRTALLTRETLVTTALAAQPVGQLCVFDAAEGLRIEALQEGTRLPVSRCDLAALVGAKQDGTPDSPDTVSLALACGAALAPADKVDSVNLRNDHMPYLGKKRRLQNAVRLLSLSVTALLLVLGVYVHAQMLQVNKQREGLADKLETDYQAVMNGKRMPRPMKDGVRDLEDALRVLRAEKTGANQGSISGMLTLVLEGINACARAADLNVVSTAITKSSIVIVADTSSRQNTLNAINTMREMLKKGGITVGSVKYGGQSGDRDTFTITAEPAKGAKGA